MMKETGKGRKSRIELGYYRTPDRLLRLRRLLWVLAIIATAGFLLAAGFTDRSATPHSWSIVPRRIASKGPVAEPHAMWDANCDACHKDFSSINSTRWAPSLLGGSTAESSKCKNCHAGPVHHISQKSEEVPACAECHRDHRGRDASLLDVDNSTCTACHQNLPGHRTDAAQSVIVARGERKGEAVSEFHKDHHPDLSDSWKLKSAKPERIKFNHKRHLTPGMPLQEDVGKDRAKFTYGDLSTADRIRYGGADEKQKGEPVKLECASCHQPEPDEHTWSTDHRVADTGAPLPSGLYMAPIVYENHCAACHTLQFEEKRPEKFARHGITLKETINDLTQLYMSDVPKDNPDLLRQFVPPRPMPGRPLTQPKLDLGHTVDDKVVRAAKLLFGTTAEDKALQGTLPQGRRGCVECHNLTPSAGPIVDLSSLAALEIERPLMTPVWQQHAIFNHRYHRALACAECHAGADTSIKNGDQALLPGIETCVKCHAPASGWFGAGPGRVSTACVECHRYHNGDNPTQNLGAKARRGALEWTIDELLGGVPKSKP
jgi:hypothetical protein